MAKTKKVKRQRVVVTDLPPAGSTPFSRHSPRERFFQITALVVVAVILLGAGVERYYDGQVLPGVRVGKAAVGGMNRDEVTAVIESYTAFLDKEGLLVQGRGRTVSVTPTVRSARTGSIDTSYDLIRFDVDATVDDALAVGRGGNIFNRWVERFAALTYGASVSFTVTVNREGVDQFLRDSFSDLDRPPQNARAVFNGDALTIQPEATGEIFVYADAVDAIEEQAKRGKRDTIVLATAHAEPAVTTEDIEAVGPMMRDALARTPFTVAADGVDERVTISRDTLALWLMARRDGAGATLAFDEGAFEVWLKSEVRPKVDVPMQEPKFEMKDEKVVAFHEGRVGRSVDAEATRLLWEKQLAQTGNQSTPLTLTIVPLEPTQKIDDLNDLGIKELVAEAWTDFRGSPPNRIHNIRRGAVLLDGVLVPPGEEFSTIKALSPITAANGFLPELVIKGDRTKPEIGGGLCQVSTTAFRVALNAGMPITARANHSYRVSYYEPPIGMDATIYDPAPDFKFRNDSERHRLLKTRVEGTRLIYQLWGTKDGRDVQMSEPKVWGIVAPEETEIIETEDLKPGEKKCIERAHVGSKASFTYTVKYADGTEKKQEFVSSYKPWRAVCLVGKDPNAPMDPENQNPPLEGEGR